MKRQVKIRFQNGLTFPVAMQEIFSELSGEFEFIDSDQPDFVVFGPYGIDIPAPGPYIRIGYFCENIRPEMGICDWAFGIPSEKEVDHPRYKRIQWHNVDPHDLIKTGQDVEKIASAKTKFCNFLYSNPVPYREGFFRQLSKYKKVDAPGKSMNNMPSVDTLYQGDKWSVKQQFLSPYKFTIAFENYIYPGYQTEKLYDAMLCGSIPIYCGDPDIGQIFDTRSFLNTPDHLPPARNALVRYLEEASQLTFTDILPQYRKTPKDRVQRKLKAFGRNLKMDLQFGRTDFSGLIDQIIAIDQNYEKYLDLLKRPWFHNDTPPVQLSLKERWREIFLNGHV